MLVFLKYESYLLNLDRNWKNWMITVTLITVHFPRFVCFCCWHISNAGVCSQLSLIWFYATTLHLHCSQIRLRPQLRLDLSSWSPVLSTSGRIWKTGIWCIRNASCSKLNAYGSRNAVKVCHTCETCHFCICRFSVHTIRERRPVEASVQRIYPFLSGPGCHIYCRHRWKYFYIFV